MWLIYFLSPINPISPNQYVHIYLILEIGLKFLYLTEYSFPLKFTSLKKGTYVKKNTENDGYTTS